MIVKPNASLYDKDRKQENIFISSPVGDESKKLIQNEEPNPQDTLDETVETFASPSDNGNLTTPALSTHETEDRRSEEGNEADLEVSKSSPGRSSMTKSVHSSGFRLPPIDMNSKSFKLTKVATPAVPVMMVNPVLVQQPHKPTPPTSPMPIDYSPTISPASSNESLFDNVIPVNSLIVIV